MGIFMSNTSLSLDFLNAGSESDWHGHLHRKAEAPSSALKGTDLGSAVEAVGGAAARGAGSLVPLPETAEGPADRHVEGAAPSSLSHRGGMVEAPGARAALEHGLSFLPLGDIWADGVLEADDGDWHRATWLGAEAHVAVPSAHLSAGQATAGSVAPALPLLLGGDDVTLGSSDDRPPAAPPPAREGVAGVAAVDPEPHAELAAAAAMPWVPYAKTSEIVSFETAAQDTLVSGTVSGTFTSATLAMNSAGTGYINSAGDEDWYRVRLEAGHTYTFAAYSFGKEAITDLRLVILAQPTFLGIPILPVATIEAEDDASGPAYGANFTGTATQLFSTTGYYYIAVSRGNETTEGHPTGQYMVTVSDTDKPYRPVFTLQEMADYMRYGSWAAQGIFADARQFAPGDGSPITITYYLDASMSQSDKDYARHAAKMWQEVANISFKEVGDSDSASITFDTL
jgi:hypothetical protein